MTAIAAILAIGLLALAAWRDLATRLIPDEISIALAAVGLAARAAEGLGALAGSLAAAALLFLALLPLAMRGALGGGDVKLAAATAIGLPPLGSWDFVVATALVGGLLGIAYLAAGRMLPARAPARPARRGMPLPRRVLAAEIWRLRRRGPLPYGVAIALGGALVLFRSPGV